MTSLAASTGLFTASEVEARLGVAATTLRQWERRYGLPRPQRNASGYRLYSADDLALIDYMCRRLEEGVSASRAAELARSHLALPSADEAGEVAEVQALEEALLTADLARAEGLLSRAYAQLGTEAVLLNFIRPMLVSIGEKWQRGEITIAHEHQVSAFVRSHLEQQLAAAGHSRFGPKVIAACGPQEYHEIGLLMLCVLLRRQGVQVQYLGANTPLGDLGLYARSVGAQAILLSLNTPLSLEAALAQRRDLEGLDLPVFVGGGALTEQSQQAEALGTWAGPDARRAALVIASALEQRIGSAS